MAYAPDRARSLEAAGPLRSMTRDTVTDPVEFRAELDRVRADALAEEREEAVIGECGLAAPIFDGSRTVVGAIGVVVPKLEWPAPGTAAGTVREAARAISRELGAPGWPMTPSE
ncbi:hypothetical protein NE235_05275 [Actinoallomurus spadix]|nr:IclR family transcriptional regulator C-terminal domain-containing protein [Actinoallomurus spadix]MCO5985515.1 hypothetical protein [Actinoallomurus spadix]